MDTKGSNYQKDHDHAKMGVNGQKSFKEGEKSEMFNLRRENSALREHQDVESGLSRFKKETGVDFMDLLLDKQLQVKTLLNGINNKDTDEDEAEFQKAFEPYQRKLFDKGE